MANIDTSTIEGFDGMSPEEKIDALLKVEIPESVDLSAWVPKATFDKKASEASALSKELKGKRSEEENAAAEREAVRLENEERYKKLEENYNELLRERNMERYGKGFVSLGMDEKLSDDTAKALADGEFDKMFANLSKFVKARDKALEERIRAELIDATPQPTGNAGDAEKESASIAFAREIGKQKAAANGAFADVLKHYLK